MVATLIAECTLLIDFKMLPNTHMEPLYPILSKVMWLVRVGSIPYPIDVFGYIPIKITGLHAQIAHMILQGGFILPGILRLQITISHIRTLIEIQIRKGRNALTRSNIKRQFPRRMEQIGNIYTGKGLPTIIRIIVYISPHI